MVGPCFSKHGLVLITVLKNFFVWMLCRHVKLSSPWLGRSFQHPLSRLSSFCGVEKSFRFDVVQTFNNVQMNGYSCSPKHGSAHFTVLKTFLIWMVWSFSKTLDFMAGPCSPKRGPVPFTVLKSFFVWMLCSHSNTFKLMAGPRPQLFLSRPSSFRLVEESFRFDVMQTFNNVQLNGGSCPPNTVQLISRCWRTFFVWMKWSFSKTFEVVAGLCFPKHGPVLFTVLKILFVWMFCRHVKTLKFMAGPRSPTSPVTAQLISRRWRIVSVWCCADFQHCSNERTVVLPQTRFRSFHGVDDYFYRVCIKFFKNIRTYAWVVLPQTRPSSLNDVEKPFRLNIKRSSLWLGRAPQHPLSRPSSFRGVEESFRFDVVQTFNNVQMNGFSKTLELMVGPCSPKHGPVKFTVLKYFFVWMLCRRVKTFKSKAGTHFPTSSVTAKLILRRWRIVWLWCCADIQQRSNERIFVLPQTRFSSFHGVEDFSHLDGMKLFKNTRLYGWAVLPQTRPSSLHGVEELFRLDVMQLFKHIQVDGWAALLNFFCHGPAHFAALKNPFVLMLCRHSTTFEWTDVRAPSNTVQSISRCWRTFLFGWNEAFQKHSNLWLGCASPNTAQFCSRCWRIYLFGCSAAL